LNGRFRLKPKPIHSITQGEGDVEIRVEVEIRVSFREMAMVKDDMQFDEGLLLVLLQINDSSL
jgi:hypothetical protein